MADIEYDSQDETLTVEPGTNVFMSIFEEKDPFYVKVTEAEIAADKMVRILAESIDLNIRLLYQILEADKLNQGELLEEANYPATEIDTANPYPPDPNYSDKE